MEKENWVNQPKKKHVIWTVSAFLLATLLIVAAATDLFAKSFDMSKNFVLGMILMMNFTLVVRVISNYFKNKSANG